MDAHKMPLRRVKRTWLDWQKPRHYRMALLECGHTVECSDHRTATRRRCAECRAPERAGGRDK